MSEDIKIPYELPEGWKWCCWGDIGKFVAGNGFKEKFQGFTNLNIPFYKVGSLKFSDSYGILYDRTNTINEDILKELKANLIPTNSIIFAKIGEAIRLNRRSLNSEPCCIDNNLMAFICTECNYKYVFYWSKSLDLYNYTNATTVPAIRKSDLENILFPLPPTLEEQQRIVNRIETLFAKLDQAKEKAQNVVDTFETRKASILHKAFTGELTKKWREENGVGDDSWEKKKLEECGKWERGRSKHRPRNAPELFGGKYPFIQTGDVANADVYINEHKQTLSEFGFKQSRLFPTGTLCITIAANIGKVAILSYDCCFPDSVVGFTPNENNDSKFMYYKINEIEKDLEELAPATAQKNLNLKLLTSVKLKVPMLPEQQEIVHILDVILEKETKVKESAEAVLEQIDLLKKSILVRAFRGEL